MAKIKTRRLTLAGLSLVVVAAAVAGTGIAARQQSHSELAAWTAAQSVPTVAVIHPALASAEGLLNLPAELQAISSAPIHARTAGYVREWRVDIGEAVKRGQILAILDAPEVEQQLAAAKADLQTAVANQKLAAATAARWRELLAKGAVSRQAADEREADLDTRTAAMNAARAEVARLQATLDFTRLTAPFDGIVTSRSVQVGALVTVGDSATSPLFTIADVSRIRAFVRVPQRYSPQVTPDTRVELTLPEYPGRKFAAKIVRSAGAVDPSSGTLLVELLADNSDLLLRPGSYAQAGFAVDANGSAVVIPPSALMIGAAGPRVALFDPSGHVVIRPVVIGRDRGRVIEVVEGLRPEDSVIDNPPDALQQGDPVRLADGGASSAKP